MSGSISKLKLGTKSQFAVSTVVIGCNQEYANCPISLTTLKMSVLWYALQAICDVTAQAALSIRLAGLLDICVEACPSAYAASRQMMRSYCL